LRTLRLPFEAIRTVYTGGQGEVHLYRNEITGVDQIGKRVAALGIEEAQVFREARVLQALRHDHLVPIFDVAVVEPQTMGLKTIEMIMPYYQRGSLCDAMVNGERFSVGHAVQFARDALLGLDELHERQRLLHRDVKAPNVFIDERGRGRLGDLGIAIPMDADGTAEAYNTVQLCAAPEVQTTKRVDRRTDIYGIGLVLKEALSGPFPYDNYTVELVASRLAKGRRAIVDGDLTLPPVVSPRLRQIISKAIARKPDDRFGSAREMIDAIDRAPFLDWCQIEDLPTSKRWEGLHLAAPGVRYRVDAEKYKRGERWKLTGRKFITTWQRCVDDQIVEDPVGRSSREFFDQMLKEATSR
jgi:serine/threonine protein kinase